MRYRIAAALLPVLMAMGCSGGDGGSATPPLGASKETAEEQPEQADLQVIEAGKSAGLLYAYVRNNEDREVAAEVEFTGFDANGNAYKESAATKSDSKAEVFQPKSTIAVALFVVLEKKKDGTRPDITKVEAKLLSSKRSDIPEHKPGKFEAAELKADQYGVVESDPVITNGYPQAVKSGVVVLMCKDAKGKVTFAGSTQFSMAANATEKIDMAGTSTASGAVASCVAYPRISDNTSFEDS
jgi:hypothetical protein